MKHLLFAAAILATTSAAFAQDEPKIGVTMGYPAAVGVLWNVADRVALRPEFTWSGSSNDSPSTTDPLLGIATGGTSSDSWQTGVGVSALFYLNRYESLRTYVAPRLAFSRNSTSSSSTAPIVAASNSSTIDAWSTSGSFGAQYTLGRHFGVFGEIGVNYTASTARTTILEPRTTVVSSGPGGLVTTTTTLTIRLDSHTRSTATRSGAGVIFYF